jgi:ABC-type antimicrobial peptide transport system permease subunit
MDPNLPVYGVQTMKSRLGDTLARARFAAISLGTFAAIALLLALIGIYGVMSYVTSQRVQEFGVRMAMGADKSDLVGLVLRQGVRLVAVALVLGMAAAFALSRVLQGLVFEIGTTDPLTFVGMAVLLAFTALAACWLPARRASRVDPVTAMRRE